MAQEVINQDLNVENFNNEMFLIEVLSCSFFRFVSGIKKVIFKVFDYERETLSGKNLDEKFDDVFRI